MAESSKSFFSQPKPRLKAMMKPFMTYGDKEEPPPLSPEGSIIGSPILKFIVSHVSSISKDVPNDPIY